MHDAYQDHTLNPKNPQSWFMGQPIVSDQISKEGLSVVYSELHRALTNSVPGAIVELGCYVGTTSLFIRRLLDEMTQTQNRPFHVYDSFDGLPEKQQQDVNAAGVDFTAGKLFAPKKEFLRQFHAAGLQPPIVHKGWFEDLRKRDLPEQIAFAFLDGDFYSSILTSLKLAYPAMQQGGVILIDDYKHDTLPGVERAVQEFFQNKQLRLRVAHNIAIIEV